MGAGGWGMGGGVCDAVGALGSGKGRGDLLAVVRSVDITPNAMRNHCRL